VLLADGSIEHVVAQCLIASEQPGLQVLSTGRRRPNPAELLGDGRFAELLAWAESNYDQVLLDCPPVLAVSDAHVIGRLVDGAIIVVRPEKNHRRTVVRAVESLNAAGCAVVGIVANGVTADQDGYGDGYGYGYGHEHEALEPIGVAMSEPLEQYLPSTPALAMHLPPDDFTAAAPAEPIRPRRAA